MLCCTIGALCDGASEVPVLSPARYTVQDRADVLSTLWSRVVAYDAEEDEFREGGRVKGSNESPLDLVRESVLGRQKRTSRAKFDVFVGAIRPLWRRRISDGIAVKRKEYTSP